MEMMLSNPFKKTGVIMEQKRALGKGLGSLIPGSGRSDPGGAKLLDVPVEDIVTNPNQPRKLFSKEALDELAQSIEEKGVLQPVIVRHLGGGKYELIAGERRYRAARQAGLVTVPVVVKNVDDNEVLELALIENIQRENLNPIEEALAYRDLLSKFQYTQEELAKRLGKDRSSVANALRLLKLPDTIRNHVITNAISMGHARALLAIESRDTQIQIANDIIANSLSVRDAESVIRRLGEGADLQEDQAEVAIVSNEENTEKARMRQLTGNVFERIIRDLRDRLKTFVKIKGDSDKGKIIVSYNSSDELNRLTQKLLES